MSLNRATNWISNRRASAATALRSVARATCPCWSLLRQPPALALILAAITTTSLAKFPEPDAIYFGSLTHNGNTALTAVYTGHIVVVARLEGVEIARALVAGGTSSYILRTPIDDGQAPRLVGSARANEKIRVYILNTATAVEAEAAQSSSSAGLSISTARGEVTALNLSTTANLDGTSGTLAAYQGWKAGFAASGFIAAGDDSTLDFDRDGRTNYAEFIAGTDPTDSASYLNIHGLRVRSGVTSVQFGPVRLSRRYILETATSPNGPWAPLATHRFPAAAEDVSVDVLQPSNTGALFRVKVEIE